MKKQYVSPETLVSQLALQTIVCGSPLQTNDDINANPGKPVRGRRRRRNQWDDEEEDEEAW